MKLLKLFRKSCSPRYLMLPGGINKQWFLLGQKPEYIHNNPV